MMSLLGLRDTNSFAFRIRYLGSRAEVLGQRRKQSSRVAVRFSMSAAAIFSLLSSAPLAHADLSSGCKAVNSDTWPKVVAASSELKIVDGVFNTGEYVQIKWSPPVNGSIATSGVGPNGNPDAKVYDLCRDTPNHPCGPKNPDTYNFEIYGSGHGEYTFANNDDRQTNVRATCSGQPPTKAFIQEGPGLLGSGTTGTLVQQGGSVALSADGSTAIVGGSRDNSNTGAAWAFIRSNGVWTQQGSKLVGTGAVGNAFQGVVAISGDGNTAIVGGSSDNSGIGAAWIFVRNNGVWTQQGSKLVGTGAVGIALQGSVAMSGDGNTAIVGGRGDNSEQGATWVFVRNNGVWTQQGSKLVGTGAVGNALQGAAVTLSGDGNTAIVGGPYDNLERGAAWVFTRSGSAWTQQGQKLRGIDALDGSPASHQGLSVRLSGNGNTAIIGGHFSQPSGAAWAFTRSGGDWAQQQWKIVGSGAVGSAGQGSSVALSADGKTAAIGGPSDNSGLGKTWFFVERDAAATHDFNFSGTSDLLWRDTSGNTGIWVMNGPAVASSAGIGNIPTAWGIVGQRDFDGNGSSDILWRDTSGNTAIWFMNGTAVASSALIANVPTNWSIVGTGDLNDDGIGDLLWRDNNTGTLAAWFMNGSTVTGTASFGVVPLSWTVVGDDNKGRIFWRDNAGNLAIWRVNGQQVGAASLGNVPTNWTIAGLGDFDGDGFTDYLWRDNNTGTVAIWFVGGTGTPVVSAVSLGQVPPTWSIVQTGDYDGDGRSDILWRDTSGNTAIWFMNGPQVFSTAGIGNVGATWSVQSVNAE